MQNYRDYFTNRNFLGLFISTVFVFANITAYFPVLPLYLKRMQASNFAIGAVMAALPVGVLFCRPLVSWIIQKQGRQWSLRFATLALFMASLLYFFSNQITFLLIIRLLHGCGVSAFTTTSGVLITDITTPKNRGRALSTLVIGNFLGFGLGPLLANAVFNTFNVNTFFLMTTIFALFGFGVSSLVQDKSRSMERIRPKTAWTKLLLRRQLLTPAGFFYTIALVQGAITTFLPLYLKNLDSGIFFLIFAASALIFRLLVGWLADRYNRGIIIMVSTTIFWFAILIIGLTESLAGAILAAVLYGSGYGSLIPAMLALIADNTTFFTRGVIFSFFFGCFDLGMFSSGYFFGIIADYFSVSIIYPVATIILAIGAIFFITHIRPTARDSLKWILNFRVVEN